MEQQSQQFESNLSQELNEHLLQKFIKLALFLNVGKIPLKREEFVKRVLKERSREFYSYMKEANNRLRDIFGFEMVEIPLKDSEVVGTTDPTDTFRSSRPKIKRSNTYLLRSTIDRSNIKELLCRSHGYAEKGFLFIILSLILIHHQKLMEGKETIRKISFRRQNSILFY